MIIILFMNYHDPHQILFDRLKQIFQQGQLHDHYYFKEESAGENTKQQNAQFNKLLDSFVPYLKAYKLCKQISNKAYRAAQQRTIYMKQICPQLQCFSYIPNLNVNCKMKKQTAFNQMLNNSKDYYTLEKIKELLQTLKFKQFNQSATLQKNIQNLILQVNTYEAFIYSLKIDSQNNQIDRVALQFYSQNKNRMSNDVSKYMKMAEQMKNQIINLKYLKLWENQSQRYTFSRQTLCQQYRRFFTDLKNNLNEKQSTILLTNKIIENLQYDYYNISSLTSLTIINQIKNQELKNHLKNLKGIIQQINNQRNQNANQNKNNQNNIIQQKQKIQYNQQYQKAFNDIYQIAFPHNYNLNKDLITRKNKLVHFITESFYNYQRIYYYQSQINNFIVQANINLKKQPILIQNLLQHTPKYFANLLNQIEKQGYTVEELKKTNHTLKTQIDNKNCYQLQMYLKINVLFNNFGCQLISNTSSIDENLSDKLYKIEQNVEFILDYRKKTFQLEKYSQVLRENQITQKKLQTEILSKQQNNKQISLNYQLSLAENYQKQKAISQLRQRIEKEQLNHQAELNKYHQENQDLYNDNCLLFKELNELRYQYQTLDKENKKTINMNEQLTQKMLKCQENHQTVQQKQNNIKNKVQQIRKNVRQQILNQYKNQKKTKMSVFQNLQQQINGEESFQCVNQNKKKQFSKQFQVTKLFQQSIVPKIVIKIAKIRPQQPKQQLKQKQSSEKDRAASELAAKIQQLSSEIEKLKLKIQQQQIKRVDLKNQMEQLKIEHSQQLLSKQIQCQQIINKMNTNNLNSIEATNKKYRTAEAGLREVIKSKQAQIQQKKKQILTLNLKYSNQIGKIIPIFQNQQNQSMITPTPGAEDQSHFLNNSVLLELEQNMKIQQNNLQTLTNFKKDIDDSMMIQLQVVRDELQTQNDNIKEEIVKVRKQCEAMRDELTLKDKETQNLNQEIRQKQSDLRQLQNQNKSLKIIKNDYQRNIGQINGLDRINHETQHSTLPLFVLYNRLHFAGEIFEEDQQGKQILIKHISACMKMKIRKTVLLYKFDEKNSTNVHQYIDNKRGLVCVVKTPFAIVAGFYSGTLNNKDIMTEKGLLISVTNNQSYALNDKKRAMTYDEFFVIFGNAQIRLRNGQKVIFSNFGVAASSYNARGKKIGQFLNEGDKKEVAFDIFQYFQVLFDE